MAYADEVFANAEATLSNWLGETFTYHPLDGPPRDIVVLVDRSADSPTGDGIDTIETVDICALDNATTGIAKGTWRIGDRGRFATDPEGEYYSFKGQHRSRASSSGWLVFQKKVNVRTGGITR